MSDQHAQDAGGAGGAHVHFVGIGGIHMSALAHILLDDGQVVSGCDRIDAPILQPLRERGAEIEIGHDASHTRGVQRVIRTVAVPASHPEIAAAMESGIPVATRAELLAEIAAPREVIAVGGAHGKTTTTAMLSLAARASGRDVGYVLGGEAADLPRHALRGSDPWLILEADEYGRAFHHYTPRVAVITNVEPDHLDYYGTAAQLEDAFLTYAQTVRREGVLIVGAESPTAASIASRLAETRPDVTILTAGLGQAADWSATVESHSALATSYRVTAPDGQSWAAQLSIPGDFNVANAIVALARWTPPGSIRAPPPRRWPTSGGLRVASRRTVRRRACWCWTTTRTIRRRSRPRFGRYVSATPTAACCCSSSRTPTAARAIYLRASGPALRASTKYFSARPTRRARIPTAA